LEKSHDTWDTINSDIEPDAATLASYDTVIWFTGVTHGGSTGPGSDGESALGSWLTTGGCFLLSSQDYYYVRGRTSFASTYLGVSAITGDVGQTTVIGAGSVFGGLGPYTLSYPFTNWSDLILPDATAENAFSGNAGNAAVDKNGGAYRTVYLGFPFEAIAAQADREQAMTAFLNWCALKTAIADFDGDGTTDVSVYRPSNASWYVKDQFSLFYGLPGDTPVPGDYNGDGITELAVYRPSNSSWYVKDQYSGFYGLPGDIAVPGDYNSDGTTDIAVFRPSNGSWYVMDQFAVYFGLPGDIPLPEMWTGKAGTAP
jgi:hypothetical protein